jgi:hypothetical protein
MDLRIRLVDGAIAHSGFSEIVLELEVVLDPSLEFLIKSSRVHSVGCSRLLNPDS